MPKILQRLSLTLALSSSLIAFADQNESWQTVNNDIQHHIKTFSKQESSRKYRSFRVEATFNAALDTVARNQLDVANIKNWYSNAKSSRLLKQVSATEFYYYLLMNTPLGVQQRDMVIHVTVEPYSSKTNVLVINYNAAPDFIPVNNDIVRIPVYQMTTRLTPINDTTTQEETEGYVDPGNDPPSWLINIAQRETPYRNILGKMRTVHHYDNYQSSFPVRYRE